MHGPPASEECPNFTACRGHRQVAHGPARNKGRQPTQPCPDEEEPEEITGSEDDAYEDENVASRNGMHIWAKDIRCWMLMESAESIYLAREDGTHMGITLFEDL